MYQSVVADVGEMGDQIVPVELESAFLQPVRLLLI